MGSILSQQGNDNFAGLQIFASVAALLGGGLIAYSTYLLGSSRGTRRV